MRCPDAELWQKTAEEEMTSLISNGTWDIVPLPKDRKTIGCRWVFKVKNNADGSVERLVAKDIHRGLV